ncbi:MAG TPA: phospholipase D family protein [Polyangiaceae bacterium]|jgi:phosphatidylserine/phosphatidylglycerophosphate/cardiolipin synthase-like enzyme
MALPPRTAPSERRLAGVNLIGDRAHYDEVVTRLGQARVSLWIATANLKDVHVEAPIGSVARARGRYVSLIERLGELARNGVEVRILHGALPSRAFRASIAARAERKGARIELRQCPRVHLKMIVVDGGYLYLGSANFTGAGLGAKADGRRNFELGVSTDDDLLLDAAQQRFDRIWSGRECGACKLRSICPKPLDNGPRESKNPPTAKARTARKRRRF